MPLLYRRTHSVSLRKIIRNSFIRSNSRRLQLCLIKDKGRSLRDPNPLRSKDFVAADKQLAFFSEASIAATRKFSRVLINKINKIRLHYRTCWFELTCWGCQRAIALLSVHCSLIFRYLRLLQALRAHVYSTKVRRDLAINTLQISSEISGVAVVRIPRETPFIFWWAFLGRGRFGHLDE